MEIFVSEKEKMFELLENYSGLEALQCGFETSQRPIFQTSLKIKSLEQHDRELLEELKEFVRLEFIPQPEFGHRPYSQHNKALLSVYNKINELLKERGV